VLIRNNIDTIKTCSYKRTFDNKHMAVIGSSGYGGFSAVIFYDMDLNCSIKVYKHYYIAKPDSLTRQYVENILDKKFVQGSVYNVGAVYARSGWSDDFVFSSLRPILGSEVTYQEWKIATEKKKEQELEVQQNIVKSNEMHGVPVPEYANEDNFLKIEYKNTKLMFTNKTSEFITISSISTYYNNNIKTISNRKVELPPESTTSEGLNYGELFSAEMHNQRMYKFKDLESVKLGATKFGFAIKYLINGKEYKFYKVITSKNAELLK
jgi:hypothetical protein